jgi:hypothetical protein
VLYLVAENDVSLPLAGMYELFARTPGQKQMIVLRRADHLHFIDNLAERHEAIRNMSWPAELAWLAAEMKPISDLCPEVVAQKFVRGLTLAHLDAYLKDDPAARRFLAADIEKELAAHGIDAFAGP